MKAPLSPYQKRKHRQQLDEKYLKKQLIFLAQHKTEILFDIRQYRKTHFSSSRNHFVHSRTVIKLLHTNKRTVRLLASYKYISSFALYSNVLFNLLEVRDFIKSLSLGKGTHKPGEVSTANDKRKQKKYICNP